MKNEQITILFSESSSSQSRTDQTYNRKFVETVEAHLGDILKTRGHVLLNDVYDQLGMQRTGKGCTNGWINLKHEDPWKIIRIRNPWFTSLDIFLGEFFSSVHLYVLSPSPLLSSDGYCFKRRIKNGSNT